MNPMMMMIDISEDIKTDVLQASETGSGNGSKGDMILDFDNQ